MKVEDLLRVVNKFWKSSLSFYETYGCSSAASLFFGVGNIFLSHSVNTLQLNNSGKRTGSLRKTDLKSYGLFWMSPFDTTVTPDQNSVAAKATF